MTLTVRDLASQPHLRIQVFAGARGLDRELTWAHSSDLPDPWDWLSGGELLMKNGRTLPRSATGQTALVRGLANAGAAALVIGMDPDTPTVTGQMTAMADRLGLPVLRVPYSVSFILLSRTVADASIHEESKRLARASRIYTVIRDSVTRADPGAFLHRLESEFGSSLFIVDTETGSNVLQGTRPPPKALRAGLQAALASQGGAVPGLLRVHADGALTAVAVDIPYEEPTLLVAQVGDDPTLDMAVLQHAATAAAVVVAQASLRQEHQRQLGAELLAQLLDSRLDTLTVKRQLAAQHIDPASARLVAAHVSSVEVHRRVHVGLSRRHIAHLALKRGDILYVLLEQAGPGTEAATFIRRRLGGSGAVGVSNVLGDRMRLPETAREAMWALAIATDREDGVAYYGGAAPLPALNDPIEGQALVDRVLGNLLEHDRRTNGELLRSLAAFLNCRRSWQRTAERLGVHRQTVVYRMRRVEQITGRTLTETADIAELWLALSAHELLTGTPALAD